MTAGGSRFSLSGVYIGNKPLDGSVMVYSSSGPYVSYGDRISLNGRMTKPAGSYMPGGLDWREYLYKKGIIAEVRASDIKLLEPASGAVAAARAVRERILSAFYSCLSAEKAAVLSGMVIGEKRNIPDKLKTDFQDSGTMHLLVASGSNVGFVTLIVYWIAGLFGIRKRRSCFAALAVSGIYVTACGLDMPLVRAYIMFAAGMTAYSFHRETDAFQALILAATVILLFSPLSLFDAGFQLSFLAVYGLATGMSIWDGKIRKYVGEIILPGYFPGFLKKTVTAAVSLVTASFFAQLFLLPLLAVYFHKISLVSFISNLFLVPAAEAGMALGFLLSFLPQGTAAAVLAGKALSVFMDCFLFCVNFFAGLPFASVPVPEPSFLMTGGFYTLAFAFSHASLTGTRAYINYSLFTAGLLSVTAALFVPHNKFSKGRLYIFSDDKGWGAMAALPSGLYMMNASADGGKLAEAVLDSGNMTVEALVLTSSAEGNYGGLEEFSKIIRIKSLLMPFGAVPAGLKELAGKGQIPYPELLWPGEKKASGKGESLYPLSDRGGGYAGGGEDYAWRLGPFEIYGKGGKICACLISGSSCVKEKCRRRNSRTMSVLEV